MVGVAHLEGDGHLSCAVGEGGDEGLVFGKGEEGIGGEDVVVGEGRASGG